MNLNKTKQITVSQNLIQIMVETHNTSQHTKKQVEFPTETSHSKYPPDICFFKVKQSK